MHRIQSLYEMLLLELSRGDSAEPVYQSIAFIFAIISKWTGYVMLLLELSRGDSAEPVYQSIAFIFAIISKWTGYVG